MKRLSTAILTALLLSSAGAQGTIQTPEQFFGFRMGTDNKLARWDKIVDYFKQVSSASDRIRFRELGKSTNGNPFVALEISSPDTLKNLDRYKQLERKLYFQGGAPTDAERDEIFRQGKVVVVVTTTIHATEIGASQMVVELVHRLATDNSPPVKKILDNVIFVLVPSLNPDGQIMVTDWFNKNLGTPFETSQIPYLYHPYVGHDNNRDMYMFTQKESQHTAKLLWHDWYPSVWLDEHQQGSTGARIFVMPATDPINPNVHPLIYRWNGILGQSQAAALEAAGKEGIIYNSTYTNFWEGAMAWSGWWHNQIGLLTEVASVRVAAPIDQQHAVPGRPAPAPPSTGSGQPADGGRGAGRGGDPSTASGQAPLTLPAPTDTNARTEYPRPWLGGHWTLRDIVDYELIATMALLDTVADRREALLRQIYEVNRVTVESGKTGDPSAILIPVDTQHDPHEAAHLVDKLQMGGVDVYRADASFAADGQKYAAGTFVIPMAQVFGRYAKDMLEKQTYPEVRRSPTSPPEPPYDVTAWSLGMLFGVDHFVAHKPLAGTVKLTRLDAAPKLDGKVTGNGPRFVFDYRGPDAAKAINRLMKDGAHVSLENAADHADYAGGRSTRVWVVGAPKKTLDAVASELGLQIKTADGAVPSRALALKTPRIGMYSPWTGGNMDEGWTRWVLEQYDFNLATLHNADLRPSTALGAGSGKLRDKYDVIILPDQVPRLIVDGATLQSIRPEYRGGIGDEGIAALRDFLAQGGTLITLGSASDLAIERFGVPLKNLKAGLTRDQHFAPGTILNVEVDTAHPLGYGMEGNTFGFYNNSPFFSLTEGFSSQKMSVVARYPNSGVVASGWLKGEELMAGRAAVVAMDTNPGRIVLFGLRPQHRAQTHATLPMLFNALYLSTSDAAKPGS
jgi:zinc carboxypeptidase